MHAAAAPLAGCVACFYWLNPSVAADRNTALLSVADPRLLRYVSGPMMCSQSKTNNCKYAVQIWFESAVNRITNK
jgi:hypothetical protein